MPAKDAPLLDAAALREHAWSPTRPYINPILMKTVRLDSTLRLRQSGVLFAACALLSAPLVAGVVVPEDKAADAPQVTSPSSEAVNQRTPREPQAKKPAKAEFPVVTTAFGVEEIQKMVAAGVSTDVITNYIQKGIVTRSLTPAELISLKEHKVPDEITTALLNRAAEIKAEARQARRGSMAYLDPDSYEFWWYHYGYPRVLASTYRTLYPYDIGASPYYGFGLPLPYGSYYGPSYSFRSSYLGFAGPYGFSRSRREFYGARAGFSRPSIQGRLAPVPGRIR